MPATKTRRKKKTPTSALRLPTKPIEPSDNILDYNHCIYGRKCIGKTTLAMGFPRALNFRFERGRQNLKVYQVPTDKKKLLTWTTFQEYLELFVNDDSYDFAVIDSVDKCYERAFEYVCEGLGVNHPNEIKNDYGETWNTIKDEFTTAFDMIQDAGKRFILLSHEKTRTFENPDGSEIERIDLTLAPKAAELIKERCDYIYYYGYAEQDRVITVRNDRNQVECAAGLATHFMDPDGKPIQRFEIPNDPSPQTAFKTLCAAWDNKLYDYDYEPPKKTPARRKRTAKK